MRIPKAGVRMVYATRAICEPLRRQTVGSTAPLRAVSKTVHDDAVESNACRCDGSQIPRLMHSMRTAFLVFAWRARG
eukprot:11165911-Lingulodinium_polyedra.AAC.1